MISKGDKKLFLIDAYALIYRAYFAFSKNPRITSKGFDTSAIYGFTNILLDLINTENPSYLGVVFDTPKKTHRHIEYSEYKANRDAMPEGISSAIPFIKIILNAFQIPILSLEGFEADDVIGTLAKQAESEGFQTYMMTPDKDFAQLVTENIFIYRPGSRGNPNEIWDINKVCDKFDINNVDQVIDFLGMVGDAVDNIPGIAGVGPKTASKLLKEYNSIEKIYDSIDCFEGKLKEKILISRENAFLSKKLATITIDAPIKLESHELKVSEPNLPKLKEVCQDLEFTRLYDRLHKKFSVKNTNRHNIDVSGQMDMFNIDADMNLAIHKGSIISSLNNLRDTVKVLNNGNSISLHLLFNNEKPLGISLANSSKESYYVIFNSELSLTQVLIDLDPILNSEKIEKILWDSKGFFQILIQHNISYKGPFFDVSIADYLINPDSNRTLLGMLQKYDIESINFDLLDFNIDQHVSAYLIEMTIFLFDVKNRLLELLKKNELLTLFYNVELPLVEVLIRMENNGINLDIDSLTQYSQYLSSQIAILEKNIFDKCGTKFNIASPKQLGDVLFVKMALLEKPKKTKSGQFSTSESELLKLKGKHSIIDDILLFRTYQKLLSTYVNTLPLLIDDQDKKIHTTFNQTITNTGRLSSKNPNLQNIPIRKNAGKDVRKAFVASSLDYTLMAADYSQIELRLIAEFSQEKNMMDAFLNNKDIHAITASKVFKVDLKDVTNEMRANAKTVNFGIIYGVSAFGLSEQSTLSRKDSAVLIEEYFKTYPRLKLYVDKQILIAKQNGYVKSVLGRMRYLRNINSRNSFIRSHDERNAVNMPIQGSAADIIKLAMIRIDKEFTNRNLKSKMVLQVHDELVFDVYLPEQKIVREIVQKNMENAYPFKVPLKVEIGFGSNWLEAH